MEVVYAGPGSQFSRELLLEPGATVGEAIERSGLFDLHPRIGQRAHDVGVWGRVVTPQDALADGDRVEIYRELSVDPGSARRRRARR